MWDKQNDLQGFNFSVDWLFDSDTLPFVVREDSPAIYTLFLKLIFTLWNGLDCDVEASLTCHTAWSRQTGNSKKYKKCSPFSSVSFYSQTLGLFQAAENLTCVRQQIQFDEPVHSVPFQLPFRFQLLFRGRGCLWVLLSLPRLAHSAVVPGKWHSACFLGQQKPGRCPSPAYMQCCLEPW